MLVKGGYDMSGQDICVAIISVLCIVILVVNYNHSYHA